MVGYTFRRDPMTTKYEVLGVSRSSSLPDLKKAYQQAALTYHPDKHVKSSESVRTEAGVKFRKVQDAWETLRDSNLRQEYDNRLDAQEKDVVISDEVNIKEMNHDEDYSTYFFECRCGEDYEVTDTELREGFNVVGCRGCSLFVRIIGVATTFTKDWGDRYR